MVLSLYQIIVLANYSIHIFSIFLEHIHFILHSSPKSFLIWDNLSDVLENRIVDTIWKTFFQSTLILLNFFLYIWIFVILFYLWVPEKYRWTEVFSLPKCTTNLLWKFAKESKRRKCIKQAVQSSFIIRGRSFRKNALR